MRYFHDLSLLNIVSIYCLRRILCFQTIFSPGTASSACKGKDLVLASRLNVTVIGLCLSAISKVERSSLFGVMNLNLWTTEAVRLRRTSWRSTWLASLTCHHLRSSWVYGALSLYGRNMGSGTTPSTHLSDRLEGNLLALRTAKGLKSAYRGLRTCWTFGTQGGSDLGCLYLLWNLWFWEVSRGVERRKAFEPKVL